MFFKTMKLESIKTKEELEKYSMLSMYNELNLFCTYFEIKPGFDKERETIISKFSSNIVIPSVQIRLTRSEKFNMKFYENLADRPDILKRVNEYMLGKEEHFYIKGEKLNLPKGGSYSYIFTSPYPVLIERMRAILGPTNGQKEGCVRKEFALEDAEGNRIPHITANIAHSSDSYISALKEIYMVTHAKEFGAEVPNEETDMVVTLAQEIGADIPDIIRENKGKLLFEKLKTYTEKYYAPVMAKLNEIEQKEKEAQEIKVEKPEPKKVCPAVEGVKEYIINKHGDIVKDVDNEQTSKPVVAKSSGQDNPGGEGR